MSIAANNTVAVIIVTHNSGQIVQACLDAVFCNPNVVQVVVVDNGSSAGVDAMLPPAIRQHSGLQIVERGDNPGFAVACNQGAALTTAPWLVFVNPDCVINADTLSQLVKVAQAELSIGIVGADVRAPDGEREAAARRQEPTLLRSLFSSLRSSAAVSADSHSRGIGMAVIGDVQEVAACSGALMLMSREVFEMLGGFDEGYRLHCEDLDICRRVRDAGLRVVVANQVSVIHHQGSSSRERPVWVAMQKHKSMSRYLRKFGGASWPFLATLAWLRFVFILPSIIRRTRFTT